jgi:CheY-like chemotaxis protein
VSHTLLLADDSVTIQRVIELTFAEEDVHVVAVSDGDQAILRLDSMPPDIVLADIGMPGKNGYEVAQYIKQTPRLAHIPVVLLTGAFEPVDEGKAAAAGCDGVLAKPFEPQLVIGRVKELLARGTAAAAAAPAERPAAPSLAAVPAPKLPVFDEVERYFDRLDAAFATLGKEAPPSAPDAPSTEEETRPPAPEPSFSPVAEAPKPVAAAAIDSPVPSATAFPPIAEAFAALLAAEQHGPAASNAPAWPIAPRPAVVSDDLIEQVSRRVLEQLSDGAVRETVADIVSKIAERLVREEIERIKSAIK